MERENAAPPFDRPTIHVDAELRGTMILAQVVRFNIPGPTAAVVHDAQAYYINMCLTPRPLDARAGYHQRWGPHRLDRLGDIFLVPPGEALQVRGGGVQQGSITCRLNAEAIHSLFGHDLEWTDQRLASTLDITNARIRNLLFRLTEEATRPGFAGDKMVEFLSGELAIELGRFCLDVTEKPVTGGLAGWRLRLIDERLSAGTCAPNLGDLAALCKVSVRQLTRGFRISRGCSIGDYAEARRMEAARRLLEHATSVKAIAFALGFSSPSSFTFAFRRATGISPSQFRQRQLRAAG